jgi:hypothetical protein
MVVCESLFMRIRSFFLSSFWAQDHSVYHPSVYIWLYGWIILALCFSNNTLDFWVDCIYFYIQWLFQVLAHLDSVCVSVCMCECIRLWVCVCTCVCVYVCVCVCVCVCVSTFRMCWFALFYTNSEKRIITALPFHPFFFVHLVPPMAINTSENLLRTKTVLLVKKWRCWVCNPQKNKRGLFLRANLRELGLTAEELTLQNELFCSDVTLANRNEPKT